MHHGKELKKIRKERKVKISHIADVVGIRDTSIYAIEDRETVQFETLKKYCKALKIPIKHFYPEMDKDNGGKAEDPEVNYSTKAHIGQKIKQLRQDRKIKVDEFAKALGFSNRQSVYSMEKRPVIDIHLIEKAANTLNVPIEKILNKELLNTTYIHEDTQEKCERLLHEKDKKIIELQAEIIELQKENYKLLKKAKA